MNDIPSLEWVEELETPVTKDTGFNTTITLTHRAFGFSFIPWNLPRVTGLSTLGVITDVTCEGCYGEGVLYRDRDAENVPKTCPKCNGNQTVKGFRPYPGTETLYAVEGKHWASLYEPNESGKRGGNFRVDDVREAFKRAHADYEKREAEKRAFLEADSRRAVEPESSDATPSDDPLRVN